MFVGHVEDLNCSPSLAGRHRMENDSNSDTSLDTR